MARLTDKDRELILADYHTGHFTQRELSRKYEVSTATINKLTKGIEPKHTDKVNAIVTATRELSLESEQEVNAVHKVIDAQVRRENLIFGNAELMASKVPDIINSFEKVNKDEETGEEIEPMEQRDILKKFCRIVRFVGNKLVSDVEIPSPYILLIPAYSDRLYLDKA